MKIVWSKTADKPFSKIDNRYKSRIKSRLEKMDDKASSISDIKKLSSPENHYRLRLGDYRVIYTFGDRRAIPATSWRLNAEPPPPTFMRKIPNMTIQYIKDEEGKDQYVVIPYSDYFRMRLALLEYDDEDESDWEDIPYESDIYDNVMLPGEVCDVMHKENVSLQAAWRILRGLSQQEVAAKLGISQSAVSQLEALDSRPQKRTREKLAAIYGCTQEQISLYLPKEG